MQDLREQIAEAVEVAIDNVHDMDVTFRDYAEASADAILELIKGAVPVWQPMETAPRDGTPILTYSGGCDRKEAHLVTWWSDDKAERCGFGWEAYEVDHMICPDMWMHLPPAPAPAAIGVE